MKRRRRLGDLYIRGTELPINDPAGGDPVTVWISKLNDIDRAAVIRRSHAAKARFMFEADNEESEMFVSVFGQIRDLPQEDVITIVISEEAIRARQRIEAQVAQDEESWAKEGYLQGLLDAWLGDDEQRGLAAAQAEDPNDPEAKRVNDELNRFDEEVNSLYNEEEQRLRADWEGRSDHDLWRKATTKALENRSEAVFLEEYERQLLYFCVRELEDHTKRYFPNLTEVDDLPPEVRVQLIAAYNKLNVEPSEGKGLRASQDSSSSSEPLEEATPQPSGLEAVSA